MKEQTEDVENRLRQHMLQQLRNFEQSTKDFEAQQRKMQKESEQARYKLLGIKPPEDDNDPRISELPDALKLVIQNLQQYPILLQPTVALHQEIIGRVGAATQKIVEELTPNDLGEGDGAQT